MSIASEITRLSSAKAALKDAIVAKGVEVADSLKLDGYAEKVAAIPTGGGEEPEEKDINFYDMDGKRLHSFTFAEANQLTEMPSLPTQEGLRCVGWNNDLEDIQRNYPVDVGACYDTEDGSSVFVFEVPSSSTTISIRASCTIANGAFIDWGDGSAEVYLTKSEVVYVHSYTTKGRKVVKFKAAIDGAKVIYGGWGSDTFSNECAICLKEAYFGSITSHSTWGFCYVFQNVPWLERLTYPTEITMLGRYGIFVINQPIIIPKSVNSFNSNAFSLTASQKANLTSFPQSLDLSKYPGSIWMFLSYNKFKATYGTSNLNNQAFNVGTAVFGRNVKSLTFNNIGTIKGGNVFVYSQCNFIDFSRNLSVPVLENINSLSYIGAYTKIVVPDTLFDEWCAATNWSDASIVSHIIKASEYFGG